MGATRQLSGIWLGLWAVGKRFLGCRAKRLYVYIVTAEAIQWENVLYWGCYGGH